NRQPCSPPHLIAITGIRDHHRLEHLITIPGMRTGLSGRLRQSEAEGVDHAKVQALPAPRNRRFAVLAKAGSV
ncbi:hypothetical protein, partial [Bradyrhizobium sp. 174]|uniref:hypothetical protein n=1 Tax=Bradyrhizobium sp. 174 TaxID=2782645 RepID=UPI001FFBB8D0